MISPDESTNILQSATIVGYAKTRISIVPVADSGTSVETVNKPIRVGTAPENDLVLADKTFSRRHCAVEPVVGGFRIRDEGSTNGLLIADARVYDAVFNGKVQIRMGDTVLAVEPMAENVEKEQSTVNSYGDLLGRSSRMRELFADLARIVPQPSHCSSKAKPEPAWSWSQKPFTSGVRAQRSRM